MTSATPPPPPPRYVPPPPRPASGSRRAALFVLAILWIPFARSIASTSATGIAQRLDLPGVEPTLSALFALFLLRVGFALLQRVDSPRSSGSPGLLALPRRLTSGREWALGALLGWGSALAMVLILLLTRSLSLQISLAWHDLLLSLVSLVGLAALALAEEAAFRGYPYRLLIAMTGPTIATIAMSLLFGLFAGFHPFGTSLGAAVTVLLGFVLAAGWLRTHALWVSWGFNFAFKASAAVLFGLPVNGDTGFSYFAQAIVSGHRGWSGGDYGLTGSWLAAPVLLGALLVLVQATRGYAWNYTHPEIRPGGYAVTAAPPAAHAAYSSAGAAPAGVESVPLVQILPAAPAPPPGGRSEGETLPGEDATSG